jgi:hypothetical protein
LLFLSGFYNGRAEDQGPEVTLVVLADPDGNEFCVLRA